ncbi:Serine-threonine/tyrosine-protein kinase, catalytic domain [Dillenia turbinata]|uniref:Serine-threonine/tyrosine-protein kinase, catalytic domain n=1 Tax=Dillenia turbinata TaxID=194707 RepID=A0AAN8ZN58_9MAGN
MDQVIQAILASTVGFFIVSLIFAVVCVVCKGIKKRKRQVRVTRSISNVEAPSNTFDESASFDPNLNRISMAELIHATSNFSASGIIGDGSFGMVYKAKLANGVTVAVKKLDKDAFQGLREFRAEMETLGKLRHSNIVNLLGYCVSGSDRVLIYEFIQRGSLDQWLYDIASEDDVALSVSSPSTASSTYRVPLSWETRKKIIIGVANGLRYLHGLDTPVVHRDIKTSNVLLDSKFEAHIADFGLARQIEALHTHVSTQVAGTIGYMPPEYREGLTTATVKVDVYSFGVLMIEVATGTRPNWPVKMNGEDVGLVERARRMVGQSRVMELLDASLSKDGVKKDEVKEYFRIAFLCSSEEPKKRPNMVEVVDMLNRISL